MRGNPLAIIQAIEQGAHRTREISNRTGIRLEVVQVRLAELKRSGIVDAYALRDSGRGSPKHYRINTSFHSLQTARR